MTTPAARRPMRDLYERYLAGKVTLDELKRETDRVADEYARNSATNTSHGQAER